MQVARSLRKMASPSTRGRRTCCGGAGEPCHAPGVTAAPLSPAVCCQAVKWIMMCAVHAWVCRKQALRKILYRLAEQDFKDHGTTAQSEAAQQVWVGTICLFSVFYL